MSNVHVSNRLLPLEIFQEKEEMGIKGASICLSRLCVLLWLIIVTSRHVCKEFSWPCNTLVIFWSS